MKEASALVGIRRLLALILLGLSGSAMALDPSLLPSQYLVDNWQIAEGMPEATAMAIARTPDGYLWVGTEEGLARFDGVRFVTFDSNAGIPDKWVSVLFVDRLGKLWVGTRGGLAVLENGRFRAYDSVPALAHAFVHAITEDRAGRLWVGTESGLAMIDGGKEQLFDMSSGLRDLAVEALQFDGNGSLWVATRAGGLHRFDGARFQPVILTPDSPPERVAAMLLDSDGTLWFGTRDGVLYRKTGDRLDTLGTKGQLGSAVRALARDHDGNLWIATTGGGLLRWRDGTYSALNTGHFAGAALDALLEDNEGSLWIGSLGVGLLRLRTGKFSTIGEPEGLPSNLPWTIVPRKKGGVWVGTERGLVSYADGHIEPVILPQGHEHLRVRAVLEDQKGVLWVGTGGAGVYRLDADHVTSFNQQSGLSADTVNAIAEDRRGRVWIGTAAGLDLIDQGQVTPMLGSLHASGSTTVAVIHEDRNGGLWVGTMAGGLFLIDAHGTRHFGLAEGLPSNAAIALYEDERGNVWIGTTNGLALWRDGRLISLARLQGPLRETIYQILEDAGHQIWLTTNKGLISVPRAELEALGAGGTSVPVFHVYGPGDGLRSAEFNGGSSSPGCRTPDGLLWFPSISGVVKVDPDHIPMNTVAPPVLIEQVTVDKAPLPPVQGIAIGPTQQQWEFQYAGLSLLSPQRVFFKYRLDGFDAGWIDAGTRRTAYYTRLPPGKYTFRVTASNNDGVWSKTAAELAFAVRPHFYQTVWFILLCALAVALAIYAGYLWRVRQFRRVAAALSAQVADRTRELELANKQMQQAQATLVTTARQAGMAEIANNVLHNVGNVLNSVNVSAALIGNQLRDSKSPGLAKAVGLMNEHAADIGEFLTRDDRGKALPGYLNKLVGVLAQEKQGIATELDSLTKSVDHIKEIVATQQSYSGSTSLVEPVQLKDLLEDALRMNLGSIARHQITVVREFAEVPLLLLDKHLMLQILINLIGNAKHAMDANPEQPHQLKLIMDVLEGPDAPRLRIRVEDNGEGIAPENLARLFTHGFTTRKNGHGFGLHSCALAMKEMKGSISAFSDGLGRGAVFSLEIPMNPVPESV